MGCIGMSREDFERCTPSEFYRAWEGWSEARRGAERESWERVRVLAMFSIQPYVNGNVSPHDLLPFPWDPENGPDREEVSEEELNRRFEEAKRRNGLK